VTSFLHNFHRFSPFHRLIRNPLGSTHPEATLKACLEHGAPEDAIQAAKAEFHSHLAANRSQQGASSHDLVEDAELMSEDREIDGDNQGKLGSISPTFYEQILCEKISKVQKD
jgi:hypothetical protein